MFDQIFLSPQVKRSAINDKHGIYEFPYELSNDLRLRILEISGNLEISGKLHRIIA